VAIVNFMNYEGWEWGKIAAGDMIMLPVVVFSLLVRRYPHPRSHRRRAQG